MIANIMGCASSQEAFSLLPREKTVRETPFRSFDEVYGTYLKVKPKTTLTELKQLGFDPQKFSGAKEWNEISVQKFIRGEHKNIPLEELKPEAQACAQANGRAWEFKFDFSEKIGETTFADFVKRELGYSHKDHVVGSSLWAWFCYDENDVVLYKLADLQPFIDETRVAKDPFSPFRKALIVLFGAAIIILF